MTTMHKTYNRLISFLNKYPWIPYVVGSMFSSILMGFMAGSFLMGFIYFGFTIFFAKFMLWYGVK